MAKASDVRKFALALDGVEEKSHFGSPSFRLNNRIFLQTSTKKNEAIFKLSPVHQELLFKARPKTFKPEIWGSLRWARLNLDGVPPGELKALVQEAYDQVAAPSSRAAKKKTVGRKAR